MVTLRQAIAKVVQPLQQRILLSVGRALITGTDDSSRVATLQLSALKGEIMSEVHQIIAYGFGSRPLPPDSEGGPEAVFVCVGGNRDHAVAIGTEDRRHRPRNVLQEGEVCLWDDQDTIIHLRRGKVLEITVAGLAPGSRLEVNASTVDVNCDSADINATAGVTIVAPTTRIEGDLEVTGNVTDSADSSPKTMAGMRSVYNAHTHPHNPHGPPTQPM